MKKIIGCWIVVLGASWAHAQAPTNSEATGRRVESMESAKQLPPTIADVVLLLQSYKPDTEKVARLRAEFDKPVPETGSAIDLARQWHIKANIATELGDAQAGYDMLSKALPYAQQNPRAEAKDGIGSLVRVRMHLALATGQVAGFGAEVDATEKFFNDYNSSEPTLAFYAKVALVASYIALGDMDRAQQALVAAEHALASMMGTRKAADASSFWVTDLERARGRLQIAQGKPEDAERSFLAAERSSQKTFADNARNKAAGYPVVPAAQIESKRDSVQIGRSQAYIEQQRFNDAELLLREVLKSTLAREGRNTQRTGALLSSLSRIYAERGRNAEALALAQWADRTLEEAGVHPSNVVRVNVRRNLADLLVSNARYAQAVTIYDDLAKIAAADARHGADIAGASLDMVRAYVATGRTADALTNGDKLLATSLNIYGAQHYKTAEVRGYRAMALQRLGRLAEARQEFEQAIGIMVEPDKAIGSAESSATKALRMRAILDSYLELLLGTGTKPSAKDVAEAFRVADVVRWQSVQKAVSGSALRAAADTPELGAKIKAMQDSEDELQAVYKKLIAQRSAPPDKQLPTVLAAMEARIGTVQKEQTQALADIRRQFPKYDTLVNPRPADLQTARQALQPNEALLSVYVTEAGTYVWAAGSAPNAELQFHFSPRSRAWVAGQVKRLRDAVDLTADTSNKRMGFDLQAAHALYKELLAPVESAWAQSDTLLVVANDALGQIPFSLLTTAPAAPTKADSGLPLSQYRQTPWLVRKVAISYLPSVSALVSLRAVASSKAVRTPFFGFGDPDFGSQQRISQVAVVPGSIRSLLASHAQKWDEKLHTSTDAPSVVAPTSSAPTSSAPPALPQLPDTRDEIIAIATALSVEPSTNAFFGVQATPLSVRQADLKSRRIVAFATHGLVAGDLPGLEQPALALSPIQGKDIYSGLLMLEDVLKLSLDADLVVLSACNTAAADGSGSEAVSGLVRGFFHAGSRSVLATHWPVETASARQLVSHLFERYSQDPGMTRAKALQRAMLEVLDKGVAKDASGKVSRAYAHPAFWAPYALYGDPGR